MKKHGATLVLAAMLLASCGTSEDKGNQWEERVSSSTAQPDAQTSPGATSQKASQGESQADASHPAREPDMPRHEYGTCTEMHPGGKAPQIVNEEFRESISASFRQVCYRSFEIGHSGRTRTAIWSAEVLDPQRMRMAAGIGRDSEFQPDDRIPAGERSELDDYRRSGYDRGHLAPSGDMPSRESQAESFRLSNIVPQDGKMNGGVWRDLEIQVRQEAMKRRVYVVTGPIFVGSRTALKNRVLVPTALYKAMYAVDKGAVVFVVTNDREGRVTTLSLGQFAGVYGIDPFPALTGVVRTHNIARGPIPVPKVDKTTEADKSAGGARAPGPCTEYKGKDGVWLEKKAFFAKNGQYATVAGIRSCRQE